MQNAGPAARSCKPLLNGGSLYPLEPFSAAHQSQLTLSWQEIDCQAALVRSCISDFGLAFFWLERHIW